MESDPDSADCPAGSTSLAPAVLDEAWREYGVDATNRDAKRRIARTLLQRRAGLARAHVPLFLRLVQDDDVQPEAVCGAGWRYLRECSEVFRATELPSFALAVEESELACPLLSAAPVDDYPSERRLTELRRWLLLTDRWQAFPRLAAALRAQGLLNGGAWLIEPDERELLARLDEPNAGAYGPREDGTAERPDVANPVTRAVAEQYERWIRPEWTRLTVPAATSLRDHIAELDGAAAEAVPAEPHILIAGCGTGRQAALWALRFPEAQIVAADISAASLRYAEMQCARLGLGGRIEFRQLDLHYASQLNRAFDAVTCAGVLHHLADPEAAWAELVHLLKPGGVMHLMLYSHIAKMRVRALRSLFEDLMDRPANPELLRQVRRRLIERKRIPDAPQFYTLGGVHDYLLPRHEDPFDIARIGRALDAFGLGLLGFRLHCEQRRRYRTECPHDPHCRDLAAVQAFEMRHPITFSGMYNFWCRKRESGRLAFNTVRRAG